MPSLLSRVAIYALLLAKFAKVPGLGGRAGGVSLTVKYPSFLDAFPVDVFCPDLHFVPAVHNDTGVPGAIQTAWHRHSDA